MAHLQSAVVLYRSHFPDGFYDDWIINERYRLETLFCEALVRLYEFERVLPYQPIAYGPWTEGQDPATALIRHFRSVLRTERSMTMKKIAILVALIFLIVACGPSSEDEAEQPLATTPPPPITEAIKADQPTPVPEATPTQPELAPTKAPEASPEPSRRTEEPASGEGEASHKPVDFDKWTLWVDGPHLRGANVYQRRVYPELDGADFMGPGPIGPPYTQEDFDRLAAMGANYVNISHPGLFTETPPHTLAPEVQDNLDHLLDMIAQADMFAVISFRTGPGRAEFSVCCLEELGDWFDGSYLNDAVWQDPAAQEAWTAMWRHTAERYRDNPVVVGYDLMVEPNADEVWLDLAEPGEFYPAYADTLYDWNQLYPRITAAIREVDPDTPILVGAMGYSAVEWLPYLEPTADPRTVYAVHQYAPNHYTHQWLDSLEFTYPGTFDTDWDGADDQVNRAWLGDLLSRVNDFAATHDVPVAVNEFGLMRWQPGAEDFMNDQMDLFEGLGINYALWQWETSWASLAEDTQAFNFRLGPDPDNRVDVISSELMDVIIKYWGRNTIRPSNLTEESTTTAETDEAGDLPVLVAESVVDDFEGGDFDDRWWSYTGGETASFTCILDQPGHASAKAMRLTFEVGADGYAGCGLDVDPGRWGEAGGLSFFWRADQPDMTVIVTLDVEDPTQTHPEAEGETPFEVVMQTPSEEWTPVRLAWDAFAKAEWVGESGVDELDPTRVVELSFDVVGEQSGSVWLDDLQLQAASGAAVVPVASLTPLPALNELAGRLSTPPAGHIYHAVYPGEEAAEPPEDGIPFEEDGVTLDDLRSYEQHVGKTATWVYFSHNWFRGQSFPLSTASWIRNAGSIPYIRLMLRSSEEQNVAEPTFTLDRIISGDFDNDLRAWARDARDFGSPLIVEYGTEVNGEWFSWNGIWNGAGTLDGYGDPSEYDGPERFRDAYRHIIQIARDEGASNITWVFHVDGNDVPEEEWNRLEQYYPGQEWIDWLGVSVYGAGEPTDDECPQFRDGLDAAYARLAELSPDKPIVLLEFGVTAGSPLCDQAEWAEAALEDLITFRWPRVMGFSWWNEAWQNDDDPSHDTNMRVQDNPELTAVFQRLVGSEPKVLGKVTR